MLQAAKLVTLIDCPGTFDQNQRRYRPSQLFVYSDNWPLWALSGRCPLSHERLQCGIRGAFVNFVSSRSGGYKNYYRVPNLVHQGAVNGNKWQHHHPGLSLISYWFLVNSLLWRVEWVRLKILVSVVRFRPWAPLNSSTYKRRSSK